MRHVVWGEGKWPVCWRPAIRSGGLLDDLVVFFFINVCSKYVVYRLVDREVLAFHPGRRSNTPSNFILSITCDGLAYHPLGK